MRVTPLPKPLKTVLVDPSTGPLPWDVLSVRDARAHRHPIPGYLGLRPNLDRKIEIIAGFVRFDKHLIHRVLRLEPHDVNCVIESTRPNVTNTTDVTLDGTVRKGDRVVRHSDAPEYTQDKRKVVGFAKGTNGSRLVILEQWWPRKQRYDYIVEPLIYFKMFWSRVGVCKPRQHVRKDD